MSDIQRYAPWPQEWPQEDPNGDLVEYEDHKKIVDALQARAEQLAATNKRLEKALIEARKAAHAIRAEAAEAEIARLVKSRNRWGQKYNSLLSKHRKQGADLNEQIAWVRDLADRLIAAEAEICRLREALIWCSGSDDFQDGGKAREGWLKLCAPMLKGDQP